MSKAVRNVARVGLAVVMITIGALHFAQPANFVKIVPGWLPAPHLLVAISGFFEIAGGAGLLVPRVRRAAGIGLILLYVAVFPANVWMAVHEIQPDGATLPVWLLWARLPFQFVFIALAWWVSRDGAPDKRAEAVAV